MLINKVILEQYSASEVSSESRPMDQRPLHLSMFCVCVPGFDLWPLRGFYGFDWVSGHALLTLCVHEEGGSVYNVCFCQMRLLHMFIVEALLMYWSICTHVYESRSVLYHYKHLNPSSDSFILMTSNGANNSRSFPSHSDLWVCSPSGDLLLLYHTKHLLI